MNWIEWGPTIVTAVIAIVSVVFISGQLTGRIEGQEKTLVKHNDRLDGHDLEIAALGERQIRAEGYNEGYSAGRERERRASH